MLDRLPQVLFERDDSKFLDPAIGGGQFVFAVENRLRLYGHSDENIAGRVFGFESNLMRLNFAVNKHKLVGKYNLVTPMNFLETETLGMKFDVILGNPPFNDDQNLKDNKGNFLSASKKMHLRFIDKSLELADHVAMVAPVRGWFVGKHKNKNLKKYQEKGLYMIENKGTPFEGTTTGEVGVFYFNKDQEFISDEFVQNEPLKDSIVDQYPMTSMVGKMTPGELVNVLKEKGKFRVLLTSTKDGFTNNNKLYEDPSRGNWRVAFNHNGNRRGKSIYGGKMQVATPTDYLSMSMSCFVVKSEREAKKLCKYLMSDNIIELMNDIKVSNTNTKYHMSFVPRVK
jgi:hypothetical protein